MTDESLQEVLIPAQEVLPIASPERAVLDGVVKLGPWPGQALTGPRPRKGGTPPPWPKGKPHPTRGRKMANPITDRRSKLRRRVEVIEKALRREYLTNRPLWRDRLKKAAEYQALAEQIFGKIGLDPTCTPPRAAKLQRTADAFVKYVPKRPPRRAPDLATALARESRS